MYNCVYSSVRLPYLLCKRYVGYQEDSRRRFCCSNMFEDIDGRHKIVRIFTKKKEIEKKRECQKSYNCLTNMRVKNCPRKDLTRWNAFVFFPEPIQSRSRLFLRKEWRGGIRGESLTRVPQVPPCTDSAVQLARWFRNSRSRFSRFQSRVSVARGP